MPRHRLHIQQIPLILRPTLHTPSLPDQTRPVPEARLIQHSPNGASPRPDESCCGAGWVGGFRSSGSPVTGVPVSGI